MYKLLKNDNIRGAVWMLGFILNITIMAISIRELSSKYSSFEIQNFRNIFSIVIILLIYVLKSNTQIKTYQIQTNFIRNIFHFIGQSAWTWGLTVLPLAVVFSIEFTMPIWAAILALIIFKENECFLISERNKDFITKSILIFICQNYASYFLVAFK